jgi:hypothetical protein
MSFTAQQVIDAGRPLLNDAAKTRHTDADGLTWIQAGLRALCLLRPDLFHVRGLITTTPDVVAQDLATFNPDALKLIDIFATEAGDIVDECDLDTLDLFSRGWRQAKSVSVPYNWARNLQDAPEQADATTYYLSPPPKSGVKLSAEYVAPLTITALGDSIALPDPYFEPLRHYYVFCAESIEDEYVVTQRAQQSMQIFMQGLGLAKQNKVIVTGGKPE